MQVMLDTNIVSYYLRRQSPVLHQRVKQGLLANEIVISSIVRAELRYGQALLAASDIRHTLIENLLPEIPTLDWGKQAADYYGKLSAQLKKQGTPIGELDTQIAAHALATGLTLITHNTKHFERVPGLKMQDWTAE